MCVCIGGDLRCEALFEDIECSDHDCGCVCSEWSCDAAESRRYEQTGVATVLRRLVAESDRLPRTECSSPLETGTRGIVSEEDPSRRLQR